jgi:hypothetical protein
MRWGKLRWYRHHLQLIMPVRRSWIVSLDNVAGQETVKYRLPFHVHGKKSDCATFSSFPLASAACFQSSNWQPTRSTVKKISENECCLIASHAPQCCHCLASMTDSSRRLDSATQSHSSHQSAQAVFGIARRLAQH